MYYIQEQIALNSSHQGVRAPTLTVLRMKGWGMGSREMVNPEVTPSWPFRELYIRFFDLPSRYTLAIKIKAARREFASQYDSQIKKRNEQNDKKTTPERWVNTWTDR